MVGFGYIPVCLNDAAFKMFRSGEKKLAQDWASRHSKKKGSHNVKIIKIKEDRITEEFMPLKKKNKQLFYKYMPKYFKLKAMAYGLGQKAKKISRRLDFLDNVTTPPRYRPKERGRAATPPATLTWDEIKNDIGDVTDKTITIRAVKELIGEPKPSYLRVNLPEENRRIEIGKRLSTLVDIDSPDEREEVRGILDKLEMMAEIKEEEQELRERKQRLLDKRGKLLTRVSEYYKNMIDENRDMFRLITGKRVGRMSQKEAAQELIETKPIRKLAMSAKERKKR